MIKPSRVADVIEWVESTRMAQGGPGVAERGTVVPWLLAHQMQKGRFVGHFAPDEAEGNQAVRLFTGEWLRTKQAARNVLTMQAVRALHELDPEDEPVRLAIHRAAKSLERTCFAARHCTEGECAISFIEYLLFLRTVGGGEADADVAWRLQTVCRHRDGTGRWIRLPFYYTLHVLLEIGTTEARQELEYAQIACGRVRHRRHTAEPYATRRRETVRRTLEMRPCSLR